MNFGNLQICKKSLDNRLFFILCHFNSTPRFSLLSVQSSKLKKMAQYSLCDKFLLKQEIDGKKATIYPTFNEIL